MAGISGYDSNSISTLFSGLSSNTTSSASSGSLGINFTDYANIRSGSYFKLMKNYYAETGDSSTSATSTSTAKDTTQQLALLEDKSESVKAAADKLLEKGEDSVFNKTKVTDSEGDTTYDYDTDKIYKSVKDFADKYNSLVEAAGDSNVKGVLSTASSMVKLTQANEKMLGKLGISIGADNKLTIDEETFKKADMGTVKSMFNSTGSFGYQVSAQASMMNYYAENEASKANTYGSTGMYTYNYATGEIYNSTT